MSFEDFMGRLDPKTAKRVKVAQQVNLTRLPLASVGLTNALGGGIGAGRMTTCYGNYSAGKTVLFLQSIGMWQKMGKVCAFVDAEGTYEKSWGESQGINNDELILIQSKSSGRIENEITPLIKNGIDAIVIDSISQVLPEIFVDSKTGEMNSQDSRKQLGAHAKAITALVNGIHYINEKTTVVLLSQTTTFIDPNTGMVKQVPHGGQKVPFASTQMIRLKSSGTEKQQIMGELQMGDRIVEQPIGRKVEYFVEKNKLGRQHMKGTYDLYYGGDEVGIDLYGEIIDLAETFGLVKKGGAWYTDLSTGEQFQGRPKFVKALKSNETLYRSLKGQVEEVLNEQPGGEPEEVDDES